MNIDTDVIAIITTSLAVIALVGKPYIETIYKQYPPDIKKHISFIKKSLLFTLQYIFPISTLIFLMTGNKPIDKWFVLIITINCLLFIINVLLDVFKFIKNLSDTQASIHKSTLINMKEIIDVSKDSTESTVKLASVVDKIILEINAINNHIGRS